MANAALVVLGIGSNRGDSRRIIFDAVQELASLLADLQKASLYKTAPLHVTDQAEFINTAVCGNYEGTPLALLSCIHEIERRFGRDRTQERRWGERTLDIDILLFGEGQYNDPSLGNSGLEIPHPRLKERRFALEPLLELLPSAVEPGTGLSYRSICDSLPNQGVRCIVE